MASKKYEACANTTGKFAGGSLRVRGIILTALSLVLATMIMAPAFAGAITVDKTTAKSNESGGNSIFGGIPTRVTWEGTVEEGEDVSSLDLVLPEGCDTSEATITLTMLDGLDRIEVDATSVFNEGTLEITFGTPLQAGSLLRVEIYSVSLPTDVDSVTLTGSYVTSAGESKELPESPSIALTDTSLTKQITSWLDGQSWVASWNSVDILRTFLKPQLIVTAIPSLFIGWLRALGLVLVGFPLAIPVGLCLAFIKMSRFKIARAIASLYINVVRGTPLFLQMYIAFFGLPLMGINLNSYALGITVLALNSSAYLAEIFRAGIQSIHKGQFEASASLGMNAIQTMFYVIIPQTVRRVIPTMTSEFILLYKDTSLLSAVGVMELMMFSKSLTANTGNMTPYIVAALYYLAVTLPLIKLVTVAEHKLAQSEGALPPSNEGDGEGDKKGGKDKRSKKDKKENWDPDYAQDSILMSPAGHESM